MIEAKVFFDGNTVLVGKYRIEFGLALIFIFIGNKAVRKETKIEEAITYCLEN